ncbi:MAG: peptide chain release factor N(5)-glutamine methyltransferase [Gemmatimonas sp.]
MRTLLHEVVLRLSTSRWLDEDARAAAPREARLLMAAVLRCAPGDVARRIDRPMPHTERERVLKATARRERGEPLAYAVGNAPFRHLTLQVDARVLIPRPETEVVVEEALRVVQGHPGGVAVDIGTGSGAVALSLAMEGRFEKVIATDVSSDALDVARTNAAMVNPAAPVEFRLGADFAPLDGVRARVIVSNPPYIAYEEATALPASVRDWEPSMALFAADGGMARYEVQLANAARYLEPGGWVVFEVDARRASETAARAEQHGWIDVRLVRDLSGRDRVLIAKASLTSVPGPEAR